MAKKTVATLQDKSKLRNMAKVIKSVKSTKSGAYTFKESMIMVDDVKEFFAK